MTWIKLEIGRAEKEDMSYIEEKLQKYVLDSTNISKQQFFVAKVNAQIVAFGRVIDHGEFFEIASVGVDYYHRRRGFGTRMLKFLIEEAKRINFRKPIYAVTHLPEFLKKGGFQEVDICPRPIDYKRKYICKLHESKIKIMEYKER